MKRFFQLMGWSAGLLLLAGSAAQASPTTTTPQWSYSFNVSPESQVLPTVGNNGSLAFTGAQNVSASGSSVVTLASLQLSSTATATDSAVLANNNWSGVLTIHDSASSNSASLTLSGSFTGPMANGQPTPATFSANNANVYFNPNSFKVAPGSGWTTVMGSNGQVADYVWKAGANSYTIPVADFSFTPPGIPQSGNPQLGTTQLNGAIAATIEVNVGSSGGGTGGGSGGGTGGGTGGGHGASTPEPSTLVLSCFGLGFAGLASWRRRRNLAAQLA
jgi:hypothetical protein